MACVDRMGNGKYSVYVSNYGGRSKFYTVDTDLMTDDIKIRFYMNSETEVLNSIGGSETINLCSYEDHVVLVVNVASRCGYTYQYEGLQKLHDLYGQNLAVLGFPANDFLFQERGSDADIADFCEKNYGVTFQMFSKITTKGKNQSPVYTWLTNKDLNGWNEKKPTWNFCKYLINEEGDLVAFFDKTVKPLSTEITSQL